MPDFRLILLFVKWPEPGRVKTRLAREIGDGAATEAYRRLVREVVERLPGEEFDELRICFDPAHRALDTEVWLAPLIEEAGLSSKIRVSYEAQEEANLGRRLETAFARAFEATTVPTRVLAMGSDCIEFTEGDIRAAFDALGPATPAELVFGPSPDGGYYLVGMASLHPAIFREIPWSTEETLAASLEVAKSQRLEVALLTARNDIDTAADWHRACDQLNLTPPSSITE